MTTGERETTEASWDVVTIGESMALFMGPPATPLRPGGTATFSFAGAESNVAIAASRLGHSVAYISRVGDDHAGRVITQTLAGEGVDTSAVRPDAGAPTSLMVRQHRTADLVTVAYYRQDGPGARLGPEDVDPEMIRRSRLLHVTGITPALSRRAREAVRYAVSVAGEAGVAVSLDVNHRELLWSTTTAEEVLRDLVPAVDLLFGSAHELVLLEDAAEDAEEAAELLRRRGVGDVVLKRGAEGATAWHDGGRTDLAAREVTAVDPVGAGDAFVAGYVSAWLDGEGVDQRLDRGMVCGAFAVSVLGDWEGTPRREELGLVGERGQVRR
jgi:2-dehydro-3-deoxygluconokinase